MNITLSLVAVAAFSFVGLLLTGMILFVKGQLIGGAPCAIEINGDPALTKEVEGGRTLLDTLSAEGFAIPSPCGGKATCKQCRVQVVQGGGQPAEMDRSTFTPNELEKGWRLSCQCKVRGALHIKLPENLLSLTSIEGRVLSNKNVATFIKELVVEIEEPLSYLPGDYMQFHIPRYRAHTDEWKGSMEPLYYPDWESLRLFGREIVNEKEVERGYSMASYPAEKGQLKFNVRIATPPIVKGKLNEKIPWGIASSYIFGLKEGDTLSLIGPYGESHMVEDNRELIFLIGGAGSSFARSHIMDLFCSQKKARPLTLWYGARALKENIYQEEYERLAEEFSYFNYHLVLSDPSKEDLRGGWPKEDPTKTNYLFKAFEEGQLKKMEEPEEALYYVCGPPIHNSCVLKLLDDYGVERGSIILDDFGS